MVWTAVACLRDLLGMLLLVVTHSAAPSARAADGTPTPATAPAAGPPLTHLRQLRELSPTQADAKLPVDVEGVLTFADASRHMLFLQDGTAGVYVQLARDGTYRAGQRVRVRGTSRAGRFTPFLQAESIEVTGSQPLPAAPSLAMTAFQAGFLEGERLAVEGRVVALGVVGNRVRLKLLDGGATVVAWVTRPEGWSTNGILHARVRVSGICAGVFNEASELIDFHLHAVDGSAVEILAPAATPSGPLPAQPIRELERGWHEGGADQVRCRGRVTLHWPGQYLFITDGASSLELRTEQTDVFQPGDEVEATGFRTVSLRRMVLTECAIHKVGHHEPPAPQRTSIERIRSLHSHGDPVEIEGDLVEIEPAIDSDPGSAPAAEEGGMGPRLILRQGANRLRIGLPPATPAGAPAVPGVRSVLRVAGVLAARPAQPGEPLTYDLLTASPAAIRVLREASWWTLQRAIAAVGGTGFVLVSALGWGVGLSQRRRRRAEQTIRRHREEAIRHRDALLELTHLVQTAREEEALPRITELVARTLGAARVGIWRQEGDGTELVCLDLYAGGTHASGHRLSARDHPTYFAALDTSRIIAADDARTDPRTREFTADYLVPNDIHSMLDVPLRLQGRASGVLCLEHTRTRRTWDPEEQNFAAAVGDQLTLLREAHERHKAERALREAHAELEIRVLLRTTELAEARDRAEAADRLKSAFLATMSHELRTPLNSILGFTGILLQGLVGPLTPEQLKQLGMVQNSARHLLSLINDVLDISKIEAGQVDLTLSSFAIGDAVRHVADLLSPIARRKGLSLQVRVDPALAEVVSDRRRVEQILINLVNNAVKFTEQGGVDVEAIPATNGADAVEIRIHDTGIGIPEDQLPRLFKPFQQLDSGLARRHEGTGLGLAICSGLARLLRGALHVRSHPGKGSTFSLILPLHAPPAR